jgi:hypothetical protein
MPELTGMRVAAALAALNSIRAHVPVAWKISGSALFGSNSPRRDVRLLPEKPIQLECSE